jgi:FkbM family methyltransferase
LWHEFRPQDILIKAALGEKPGQTTFHIFDKAQQVSTGSPETLAHWKKHGLMPNRTVTVPVRTLNDILAQHLGARDLHLVSLDVEGMEREVLLGLDLQRYRPWIIIIEATVPGTRNPSFDKWETIVLKARYEAVYFDGINRFYLSEEQRGLQSHFRLPPNIWDDYVLAAQVTQQKKIAELEQQVEKLTVELKARSAGPQY